MNELMIKEVDFNGDSLMAAQDKNTNDIYVGVSWVCSGIGFNKNQKDRQVKNIQSDEVLRRGCVKFDAGVFDRNNKTLAIKLDFLPLWLAKISITPKMKKEKPLITEKLIRYQLKAKEALANAFIYNEVPGNYKEALVALVESIEKQEKLEKENKKMIPKANAYDSFIDGTNYQTMNEVAKALGYGRNRLFKFLRNKDVLMSNNVPYQTYLNRNLFVVKEKTLSDGKIKINRAQTYVTPKGVEFINRLMDESNIERDLK